MNRRELFRFLPVSAVGIIAPIAMADLTPRWDILDKLPPGSLWTVYRNGEPLAKRVTVAALRSMKLEGDDVIERQFAEKLEPSPWVEITCQGQQYDYDTGEVVWRCDTRFKFIRGAHPICPKCGATQLLSHDNGHFDKMAGIEVK